MCEVKEKKEVKTRFNVGDYVYIVKDTSISKQKIHRIQITIRGKEQPVVEYVFRIGFSGSYIRCEEEVFATPKEALEYLSKHIKEVK